MNIHTTLPSLIAAFRTQGISVLESASEQSLRDLLLLANDAYHNTERPLLTDPEYDIIENYVTHTYGKDKGTRVGAPLPAQGINKVQLPYPMPSMDKIKPDTAALAQWKTRYPGSYVLSYKLDGISGLYSTEGGRPRLYTRGDGKIGQDVSHLLPHLQLPLPTLGHLTVRGEFIVAKPDFHAHYRNTFANVRNMVAGMINQKMTPSSVQHLRFVAYEVIYPAGLPPSQQFKLMEEWNVRSTPRNQLEIVPYVENITHLSNEMLSEYLVKWRPNNLYDIDGIIVAHDAVYTRATTVANPEHAFAFKMVLSEQRVEATVVDVLWTPSKDGYLKPRVQLEPVQIGGVRIEFATGFNAAFIEEHRIGVGAVVDLVRSGDVIPYIRSVLVPCAGGGKMPAVPFQWNATHVDVLLLDKEADTTVREKNITGFFRGIGVDGLSSGNIARLMEAGFDSVVKILRMTKADFLSIPGFQEKMSEKLYGGIREKVEAATLTQILVATNLLGRGISEKKIELVLQSYPEVFLSEASADEKREKIAEIKGMAQTTATLIVQNIPQVLAFLRETGLSTKLVRRPPVTAAISSDHPLFGKSIVFSGFRDTELQRQLEACGAKITGAVTKNTFALLVRNMEEETEKKKTAIKFNIPILTPSSLQL
jgi:NAD-dependent DNA ligase